jgi:nitrite reductase/ring-hydroxylating ferredoxin subunit
MSRWFKIAEVDDVPLGTGKAFIVEGYSVAVFNVDGRLYAIDDSCPHQGSSLAMGRLEGCIVTCRSHGLKVNVTGGNRAARERAEHPMLPSRSAAGWPLCRYSRVCNA